MTTPRQIEANRRNALMSTGPSTEQGKRRSRKNALRHGLTAETVIEPLEEPAEYEAFEESIVADYAPQTASERELVCRLASLMWRVRRATAIETGLLQIQAGIVKTRRDERDMASAFHRLSSSFVSGLFRARGHKADNNNNNNGSTEAPGSVEHSAAGEHREPVDATVKDPASAARDLTVAFLRLANVDNGRFRSPDHLASDRPDVVRPWDDAPSMSGSRRSPFGRLLVQLDSVVACSVSSRGPTFLVLLCG